MLHKSKGRREQLVLAVVSLFVWGMAIGAVATSNDVAAAEQEIRSTQLAIVTGAKSTGPELKAAKILEHRILKRSSVTVTRTEEQDENAKKAIADSDTVFVVGTPEGSQLVAKLMGELGAALPTLPNSDRIHPESFAVKSGAVDGKNYVVIAGADPRGTLYGVGWVLRAMTYLPDTVLIPPMDVRDKPAFSMRGGNPTGPGSRARQYGNLRPRTHEEHIEMMEDLILLGTNTYGGDFDLIRSYGMLTVFSRKANEMPPGFPKEWYADGGRESRYVCPSIPEARKALLESFDEMFGKAPDYDFFKTKSGDPGGCRCDKCMPWGGTYIRLLHEIAGILHKYHPETKILATNQDLTSEGDQAIFDYLNSQDSSWLHAIHYGPAADQMQTYIRGPVHPQWFEYEGFGPLSNYLKLRYHELPHSTNISLFSDITHWMQSQFAVPHPDVALAAIYSRRSWNARPRNFAKVGREILNYALGDIPYSEGMHDDFNKWFWYRLLWNPQQDAESITHEYCRYWFGPKAADEMTEAIFVMEQTLEEPVVDNPEIAKAVELVRSAGAKIPENLRASDYRWRIISQKALVDRYIQLKLQQGEALKDKAGRILARVNDSSNPRALLTEAASVLEKPANTPQMNAVLEEARKLGEESNKIIGYRVPATFFVEEYDLAEVGWWKKTLDRALVDGNNSTMKNVAKMILDYENPGEGGFYDNLGWPNDPKHLVRGEWLWGFMPFPGPAKRSHYNLAYTMVEPSGVSLTYESLDSKAQYVVRISIGIHLEESEEADILRGVELKEGIQADGQVVSEEFAIPRNDVIIREFDVPRGATKDGKLEITLTNSSPALPITGAYEVWLMRKDKMPWTVECPY
jgi:uncharacterized protein (DUF1778 family)